MQKEEAQGMEICEKTSTLRRNHPIFGLLRRKQTPPQVTPPAQTYAVDNLGDGSLKTNTLATIDEERAPSKVDLASLPIQPSPQNNTNQTVINPPVPPALRSQGPFNLFEEVASNISRSLSGLLPGLFDKDHHHNNHHSTSQNTSKNVMAQSNGDAPGSAPGSACSGAKHFLATGPKMHCACRLVLKFATLIDGYDQPSFVISEKGCTVGRGPSNLISIPTDSCMIDGPHALIDFDPQQKAFYLRDTGQAFGAAVQIGKGLQDRDWPLSLGCAFSAGNSVLVVDSIDCLSSDPLMWVSITEGPLKGERRKVEREGASLGRATENSISIPDRELSRRHSEVLFDQALKQFYVCDVGSTNGTYMQLVGPYSKPYKLSLQDNILVGRTCFSINRFDYGLSEEVGMRRTMEDRYSIEQDLGIEDLAAVGMCPQTFIAVYDGHGGPQASTYLWENLHVAVTTALTAVSEELKNIAAACAPLDIADNSAMQAASSRIVIEAVRKSYHETDQMFIQTSNYPQAGSTATAALILGQRMFLINVGDSRALLCRNKKLFVATEDHKPYREDEEARIKQAGGFVVHRRVMGELAVSRAFGDSDFKKGFLNQEPGHLKGPLITCDPEIMEIYLQANDDFLLLACDGLFDVYGNEEAIEFVIQEMTMHHNAHRTCENLSRKAIEKGSRDNITIVLIILNEWW